VGGTVYQIDFVPAIIFATLYGCLIPLMLYRMLQKRGRCTLLIGTISFSIERIVIFALRAVQARSVQQRFSSGLLNYMQVSFGLGYIGISNDLVGLLRCLLINPTYGSQLYEESPAAATKDGVMEPPPEGTPDMTVTRFWVRRFTGTMNLLYIAATVTGTIANSNYAPGMTSQATADRNARLRIASGGICLFLTLVLFAAVIWGHRKLSRMSTRGAIVFASLISIICVISCYRFVVMPMRITSLNEPISLDTPGGKAVFYLCHVLPEWLASLALFGYNIRKTFGTGLLGDYRFKDETETQKRKRHERMAKRKEKKAVKSFEESAVFELAEKKEKYNF